MRNESRLCVKDIILVLMEMRGHGGSVDKQEPAAQQRLPRLRQGGGCSVTVVCTVACITRSSMLHKANPAQSRSEVVGSR